MAQAKREIIAAAIEEGGQTKESLMELAEVNSAGLSSQFTYLRLTGRYPMKNDEGIYYLADKEEWDKAKEEALSRRATPAPKKSPEERLEALQKRLAKLQAADEKRQEAFAKDETELNSLKAQKAGIEVEICNLEISAVQAEIDEAA
jgi:hypothetical protein